MENKIILGNAVVVRLLRFVDFFTLRLRAFIIIIPGMVVTFDEFFDVCIVRRMLAQVVPNSRVAVCRHFYNLLFFLLISALPLIFFLFLPSNFLAIISPHCSPVFVIARHLTSHTVKFASFTSTTTVTEARSAILIKD